MNEYQDAVRRFFTADRELDALRDFGAEPVRPGHPFPIVSLDLSDEEVEAAKTLVARADEVIPLARIFAPATVSIFVDRRAEVITEYPDTE